MNERNQTTIYNTSITPVGISTNDSPLFSVAFNKNVNEVNEIYGGYLESGNEPARETIAVKTLPMSVNVEISMIAAI